MKLSSKLMAAVFAVTALFFVTGAKAQLTPAGTLQMGIGFDAGIPTGNLTISSDLVLGGTIALQYGITNNVAVTLTSGANHFLSKTDPNTGRPYDSFGIIPIKAGVKVYFAHNGYFGLEGGIGIEETDSGVGNTKYIVAPAVGYATKHWDVSIRYENDLGQMDNYGYVALRIAYGFTLVK